MLVTEVTDEDINVNKGYCICLNEWLYDTRIKNELHLLLAISSLTAKNGYCYASNEYFSKIFDIDNATVSRKIKKLENLNYITIIYKRRGCEIEKREIRLTKLSDDNQKYNTIDKNINRRMTNLSDDGQKYQSSNDENINRTIDENVKENNISINNTSINNLLYIYTSELKFFLQEYEKVFLNVPILTNSMKDKICEIMANNPQVKDKLPEIFQELKNTEFKFKNATVKPDLTWLLKDNNFCKLANGGLKVEKQENKRTRRKLSDEEVKAILKGLNDE